MNFKYPNMGVCGLPCQLCSMHHISSKGKCGGCKSEGRMKTACFFSRCAANKKGIEFCWECDENHSCKKWNTRRASAEKTDSVKCCYQKLEDDISFIQKNGIEEFKKFQDIREKLLRDLLKNFNEGRSKSYYCVAATVMEIKDLKEALQKAKKVSEGFDVKAKSKILHAILDDIAEKKKIILKLRR